MTYTCQTCSLTLEELGKHLSQTRHKKVKYDPLDEVVECEECGNDNIHLIHLLRFGLSDMALLCSDCIKGPHESALAEYTLNNGSLLVKLPQYYTFRDIECKACHKETSLFVGREGDKVILYCSLCLEKHQNEHRNVHFISEDDDKFLSVLLGITEHVPKTSRKHNKRKVGRKGGRVKRESLKPEDPEAAQRRAHYENKKATEAALKSGKTIKAVGSGGSTPVVSKTSTPAVSRSSTPKPVANGTKKSGKSELSGKRDANVGRAKLSEPKRKETPNGKSKDGKTKEKAKEEPKEKLNEKPKEKPKEKPRDSKPSEKSKTGNTKDAKSTQKSENGKPKDKPKGDKSLKDIPKGKPKDKSDLKTGTASLKGKKNLDLDKKSLSTGLPETLLTDTSKAMKASKKKAETEKRTNEKSPKPDKAPPKNPPQTQKGKESSEYSKESTPVLKLPPGIKKYEPSSKPKLTFDSMNEYFNEMCYNLFLEEKASLSTSSNTILTANEFELEWYADQDKKHKQFKFSIVMTPEFMDRFVSKKMQALKKMPFSVNQSVFLILGDDIPWYGNIVLCEVEKPKGPKGKKGFKKGRRPGPSSKTDTLDVIVELYSWNNMPLPLTVDASLLRILPVSIPVSRVFLAMSRIENPKFIDMILGKKPIKQIVFKNFLKFTKDTFNDSQKVAIQSVLNNSITVLQGPPGTGKTSTIYEIILQLLENLNTFPILVVAASNIAIDNIAEKLLPKHEKSILRIVSNEKEPEYNREHPLSSICLHHKVFDGLPLHFQETIREMRRPGSSISQNQYKKLLTAQIDYTNKLISLARVIFTTTVVAGGNQLKPVQKMPVVIMDEATQSSEPTTLIPLSMPGVEKFVFVGDQKQLSSFSQVPNLSLSLFERILLNGSYKTPHMLDTQYRMHPAISAFPRQKFYGGLLKDGITAADRTKPNIPANPVLFWDTCGKAREGTVRARFREDNGLTYANRGEIDYVEKVLTALIYEKGIERKDIGVITPYRGQRDMMSSTLVKNDMINPEKVEVQIEVDRDDFFNESKPITIHMVSDIMIASIDAFQGREKDFLVMSCVRSNEQNKIGFLNDARRMNVALTRAKYGLILIGDMECLSRSDPLWNEYIETLKANNCILTGDNFNYS